MNVIDRLALAIHEADLDGRCKAKGAEREKHVNAYRVVAERLVEPVGTTEPTGGRARMTISPDTRSMALEALEMLLEDYRSSVRNQPDNYDKQNWRGELHRRAMASRMRDVRAAIKELDGLRLGRAA